MQVVSWLKFEPMTQVLQGRCANHHLDQNFKDIDYMFLQLSLSLTFKSVFYLCIKIQADTTDNLSQVS